MSDQPTISGSCLCQQIRYELTGDPQVKLLCHCENCRKVTGFSFMANAVYQEDVSTILSHLQSTDLTLTHSKQLRIISGEDVLKIYKDRNNSKGTVLSRALCSNCSSPLFITNSLHKGMLTVTSGTMDLGPSKTEWAPQVEVFCKSRREWLPSVEGTATCDEVELFK